MKFQFVAPALALAIWLAGGYQATAQTAIQDAQRLLSEKSDELQLTPGDFDCLILKNEYESRLSGVKHSYLAQCYGGIEVYNAIFNIHFTKAGELLTWGSRLVPDLAANIQGMEPGITPEQAVSAAALQLGLAQPQMLTVKTSPGGAAQEVVFENSELSVEDIPVRLMYQPMPDGSVRLAWDLNIYPSNGQHWWSVRVDAFTGAILHQDDWVVSCHFGHPHESACNHSHGPVQDVDETIPFNLPVLVGNYNVYAEPVESPSHGGRTMVADPDDPMASPYGWHDTNGAPGAEYTITRGNNVYAQLDDDANNSTFGFAPDGGPDLIFDFPINLAQQPSTYTSAAITNLFYWNNFMHDLMYKYGFDEPSGNFQQNNYGNGGAGSDYVIADAQDAGGMNNANFSTPPDGTRPRMQMYLWNLTSPMRDGDLDNGIIAHEYGHGVSIRQTGGPATSSCLNNNEQMGEGWSDYYSLMTTMEPGDQGTDSRGIGTYALGQPPTGNGIRPTPYSTNMTINPTTYANLNSMAIPHGVGYVWCTMIWEMTWAIIEAEGMATGYDVAMNIVNEGLKLQPCSPGFVNGRNAILAADLALYNGAHTCTIWSAFAKRGLGFSASQGSSNSITDGTPAFDMPPTCVLAAQPTSASICQPDSAVFLLNVGSGNGDVALSAIAGVPPGATVDFSVNPVPPSGTSTMTIGNMGAVAPGTYMITVEGVGASFTIDTEIELIVHSNPPTNPVLLTPPNNATGTALLPTLEWSATGADIFTVEVATDSVFNNIVESADPKTASYTIENALSELTTYFWRVKATNACGETAFSVPFRFTTGEIACNIWASTNVPVPFPVPVSSITSTLVIPASGTIEDVNVKNLNVSHTWINDMIITLTSPMGTNVIIMHRPCGSQDNVLINFDDEAATATFPCPPTNNGTYKPYSLLSAFDGQEVGGTWTLTIQDVYPSADGGTLNAWGLEICYVPTPPVPPLSNPSACQLNRPLEDDNCPTNDVFQINVENAPGDTLGTNVVVTDVDLIVSHTWTGDLKMFLVSPSGVSVELSTNNGGSGDHYGNPADTTCTQVTNFNMIGANGPITSGTAPFIGSYIPEGDFADFNDGSSPIGLWELRICDDVAADVGALQYVNITFGVPCSPVAWYADADGDGYGDPAESLSACDQPAGYVADNSDCDDTNPDINPGAAEICNGVDDNCNSLIDDADPGITGQPTWYADADGDGFGDVGETLTACNQPADYVADNTDCDDTNSDINPDATEICNGVDDNCNSLIDDADPGITGQPTWYADADGDGFGDIGETLTACNQPAGYVADDTDCDDTNPDIYPGAAEICNGVDDDCNGSPEAASNIWTGNGDGLNWSDPANWSDGIVPLTCQDVSILPGGNVKVAAGTHAVGRTLDVPTTAVIVVEENGTLIIQE